MSEKKIKRSKRLSIYYLKNGEIAKVGKDDIDFNLASEYDWAIMALQGAKGGKLIKLSLINLNERKVYQEYTVNDALIRAFEYDISREKNCFLENMEELKEFFYSNVTEKNELREKTEIKKFMFALCYNYSA